MPSVFEFKEEEGQFVIYGRGSPIIVALSRNKTCFEVRETPLSRVAVTISTVFGLYQYYRLSEHICKLILNQKCLKLPSTVSKPFIKNIGRSLGRRLHTCWQHLLYQVPARIKDVQKAIFAVSIKSPLNEQFLRLETYQNYEFCNLVVNSRAAAVATFSPDVYIPFLDDSWIDVFSDEGLYSELAQTLDNLPGGVTPELFFLLKDIKLTRPIKGRLKMLTLLYFIHCINVSFDPSAKDRTANYLLNNFRLIEHSSDKEFEKAVNEILVLLSLARKDLRKIKNARRLGESFAAIKIAAASFNELVTLVVNAPPLVLQTPHAVAPSTVTINPLDFFLPLAV